MTRADMMQQMIDAHKKTMLENLMDVVKASAILAGELGVSSIYVSGYSGSANISFYNDKFPYEAGEAKRKTAISKETQDEMVIQIGDISLSCFVPKEG